MKIDSISQQCNYPTTNTINPNNESTEKTEKELIRIGGKEVKVEINKNISEKEFIESIEKANIELNFHFTNLKFSIHEETHQILVKVIDQATGNIIREIPPEKILDAVAERWKLSGIIVDEKV